MNRLALGCTLVLSSVPPLGAQEAALSTPATAIPGWDAGAVEHLLNRAAFGATGKDIELGLALGRQALVQRLIARDTEWKHVDPVLFRWEDFGLDHRQMPYMESEFYRLSTEDQIGMCKDARETERAPFFALTEQWNRSMAGHHSPVRDRMTLFWHGLFTTSLEVNKRKFELLNQFQWIRAGALENYGDLLHQLVEDAAILQYLDNTENRAGSPNENFARELMELFSLGEGNYSERDVREAARALTGYAGASDGSFVFLAEDHDEGEKTIFGVTGNHDAHDLVDILLAQDACPRWISLRMLRHFEGAEPSPERVATYAALLRKHQYAVTPVLRALFQDEAFYRPGIRAAKISGPIEYLASIGHKLEFTPSGEFTHRATALMGQALYSPPSVKGWPSGMGWMSNDALMRRGNAIGALVGVYAYEQVPEVQDDMLHHWEMRELASASDGRYWVPSDRLIARFGEASVDTDAEVVDWALEEWLAIPVPAATRAHVLDFFKDERRASGVTESGLYSEEHVAEFDRTLRRLAHVVFSLPEAQLR